MQQIHRFKCQLSLCCTAQVANGGGLEALVVDMAGRVVVPTYGQRVAFHESGHFLIAYLMGLLPKSYTLSALDAFRKFVPCPGQ